MINIALAKSRAGNWLSTQKKVFPVLYELRLYKKNYFASDVLLVA
jgi:hypothetical protein